MGENMKREYRALSCLGLILLIVGFFCMFYREKIEDEYYLGNGHWSSAVFTYSFENYAIYLISIGVILIVLALLLSARAKEEQG